MNASSLGDISTDDNAVDMQIKQEDGSTSNALTNNNERIPILDDDDDVVILPAEEPVIQEIPDDDDHEGKGASPSIENSNGKGDLVSANSDAAAVASQDTGISTQPDSDNIKGKCQMDSMLLSACAMSSVFHLLKFPNPLKRTQMMTSAKTTNPMCKFWSHKSPF